MTTSKIESTSDERVGQSTVRHQYRTLSDAENQQMSDLKDIGQAFINKLYEISGTDVGSERFASRDLSLANTHAEDAVMRAVRHVTK